MHNTVVVGGIAAGEKNINEDLGGGESKFSRGGLPTPHANSPCPPQLYTPGKKNRWAGAGGNDRNAQYIPCI